MGDPSQDPELYAKYEKWGLQILTTAVLSILVTAPIGLLVIQNLGHRWLEHHTPAKGACDTDPKRLVSDDRRDTIEMRADLIAEIEKKILAETQTQCASFDSVVCDVVDLEDIKLETEPHQELPHEHPQKQSTPFPVLLCSPVRMCTGKLPVEECHV